MPQLNAPFILASGSPRRRDLLEEAGYQFTVVPPDAEEIDDPARSIQDLTQYNARLKAECVAEKHPEAVVLAADTLVLRDNTALGKPADREEAAAMIRSLNGKSHEVFTAVCLIHQAGNMIEEFTVATEVQFKDLSEAELDEYHRLIDPMDKAGAYAAQDHGTMIIRAINGSRTNVIGLPMDEVNQRMQRFTA